VPLVIWIFIIEIWWIPGSVRPALSLSFIFLAVAAGVLGIVLSAKGMSRRFANRGLAIAGLVVSITITTALTLFLVAGLMTLAN